MTNRISRKYQYPRKKNGSKRRCRRNKSVKYRFTTKRKMNNMTGGALTWECTCENPGIYFNNDNNAVNSLSSPPPLQEEQHQTGPPQNIELNPKSEDDNYYYTHVNIDPQSSLLSNSKSLSERIRNLTGQSISSSHLPNSNQRLSSLGEALHPKPSGQAEFSRRAAHDPLNVIPRDLETSPIMNYNRIQPSQRINARRLVGSSNISGKKTVSRRKKHVTRRKSNKKKHTKRRKVMVGGALPENWENMATNDKIHYISQYIIEPDVFNELLEYETEQGNNDIVTALSQTKRPQLDVSSRRNNATSHSATSPPPPPIAISRKTQPNRRASAFAAAAAAATATATNPPFRRYEKKQSLDKSKTQSNITNISVETIEQKMNPRTVICKCNQKSKPQRPQVSKKTRSEWKFFSNPKVAPS